MSVSARPEGWIRWTASATRRYITATYVRYKKLPLLGKLFVWFLIAFHNFLAAVLIFVGPERIAQWMYDVSQQLARNTFGWLILGSIMVVTSFPPMVGYSTSISLCGFAYGVKGFLLAGPAALIGSSIVFLTLRYTFKRRLREWTRKNEKWQALEEVIRAKGLPLIILIRFSPLPPWVYSNALFASIESVSLFQFIIATTFCLPKILLAVFIGSRIAALSDRDQRGEMDTPTKILNGVSIALGLSIGFGTGWVVYRLVEEKVRNYEGLPGHTDELAAEALEEAEQGAPLLRGFSSDSLNEFSDRPNGNGSLSRSTSASPLLR